MKLKLLFAGALAFSSMLTAQDGGTSGIKRQCGTQVPPAEWDQSFNKLVDQFVAQQALNKSQMANYVIPVVVHLIHNNAQGVGVGPNLSKAQVLSQITALNNDFAGTGVNVNNTPSTFAGSVANTNITFCLAQLDPNGNSLPEAGIHRVNWQASGFGPASGPTGPSTSSAFQTYMDTHIKPNTIWDPSRYLNIWVSEASPYTGLLGYATFPAASGLAMGAVPVGNANSDGVWVWSRAFGTIGQLENGYNLGRTATHEIGHWLGLRHIWGDSNCGNDYCNDTPPQQASTNGCLSHPYNANVCSGNTTGEMFMNFMDYGFDGCLYMFTQGQSARMQTAMANGTYRKFLTASSSTMCNLPAESPAAIFGIPSESCIDSVVVVQNQSTGMPGPTYSWSASPANAVNFIPSPTAANPTLSFAYPGTFVITMEATNSAGNNASSVSLQVNDCSGTVGISHNGVLSQSIRLMPNPAQGSVKISGSFGRNKPVQVAVHNSLGQLVGQSEHVLHNSNEFSLDLEQQPDGVYTVSIRSGQEIAVKRLVLQR